MPSDFPPKKDAELATMSANAATKISATPTAFGLTTAIASAFSTLNDAFQTAYALAVDPPTRTKSSIAAKDAAKAQLIGAPNGLRDINRFVQATRAVTDAQKIDLGLPVYASRTPIPAPDAAPTIKSIEMVGRRATVTLRGLDGDRRSRPPGVQGAVIFSFVGDVPPDDLEQWKNEGMATRTSFEIAFAPSVAAGAQVWIAAAWYSPRGQAGPACAGMSTYVGGGPGMRSLVENDSTEDSSQRQAA